MSHVCVRSAKKHVLVCLLFYAALLGAAHAHLTMDERKTVAVQQALA